MNSKWEWTRLFLPCPHLLFSSSSPFKNLISQGRKKVTASSCQNLVSHTVCITNLNQICLSSIPAWSHPLSLRLCTTMPGNLWPLCSHCGTWSNLNTTQAINLLGWINVPLSCIQRHKWLHIVTFVIKARFAFCEGRPQNCSETCLNVSSEIHMRYIYLDINCNWNEPYFTKSFHTIVFVIPYPSRSRLALSSSY